MIKNIFHILILSLFTIAISHGQSELMLELSLRGYWKFSIGDNMKWASKTYDDSRWEEIRVPDEWESNGFNGYDGFAWYRTSFDGKKLKKGGNLWVAAGYIDDCDEVYFNGVLIGKSGSFPPGFRTAYKAKRQYVLPEYLIDFNGTNVISIRVYDSHLEGGIVSGKVGIYIDKDYGFDRELSGIWKFSFNRGDKIAECDYDDSKWESIMVPSLWEKQGFGNRDGTAWYRKEMRLTEEEADQDWVLILGFIDDFDKTYVNGNFVGQTSDRRRFGSSESYSKLRIYRVKKEFLESGVNVLAVKVTDIGIDGGIYKGPIGMYKSKNYDESMLTRIYRRN